MVISTLDWCQQGQAHIGRRNGAS